MNAVSAMIWLEGINDFGNAGVGANGAFGAPYVQSAKFSTNTPKGTVTFDLTDDTSVYASAGKGFRLIALSCVLAGAFA